MTSRTVRSFGALAGGYPELLSVLAAGAIGLTVPAPLRWADSHQGINIVLALLVFATAITIDRAALRRLPALWRPLAAAVVTGIVVLPPLSWLAAHAVAAGPLRDGTLVVGLAPCEVASVATTAMAGGEAALAAGVLVGSTVATIVLAVPVLTLESGHARLHPASIITNLVLVVAVPLVAGVVFRSRTARVDRIAPVDRVAGVTAIAAVAALVALIAAEVRLDVRYLALSGALALFLAVSAIVGGVVGCGWGRSVGRALLLTTSMRDFAVAAALATAAFGPAAAAPLGLYGALVLLWGTAAAGTLRRRTPPPLAVRADRGGG